MSDDDKLERNVRSILNYSMQLKNRLYFLVCFVVINIVIILIRGNWVAHWKDLILALCVFGLLQYSVLWNWTYIGIFKYSETVPFSHAFVRLLLMFFYFSASVYAFGFCKWN